MSIETKLLWLIRGLWVGAAVVALMTLAETLQELGTTQFVAIVVPLWLCWLGGFVGLLVPSNLSLTTIRVVSPILTAVWISLAIDWQTAMAAAATSSVLLLLIYSHRFGFAMVNGSAYGSEKRYLLAPPVPAVAVVNVCGAASIVAAIWSVRLIQGGSVWIIAAAALFAAATFVLTRFSHQLSLRWIVFVPAGLVVHDPIALSHSALFRRPEIEYLTTSQSGTVDDSTLDLSMGAPGLSSSIQTKDELVIDLRSQEPVKATNIRVTPSAPGALLKQARLRGIKTKVDQ